MNKSYSIFYLKKEDEFLYCSEPIESFVYYKDFRINLLNGKREDFSIQGLLALFEIQKLEEDFDYPRVIHLFYEFGHLLQGQDNLVPTNKILAITIRYSSVHRKKTLRYRGDTPLQMELKDYPTCYTPCC